MSAIVFYFQVHQPYRLNKLDFFKIISQQDLFDDDLNRNIINRISDNCYIPACSALYKTIEELGEAFRCAFSISGTLIEQLRLWRPDVLDIFRDLVQTGCVEILGETYYHSLCSLYSESEFYKQVKAHKKLVEEEFETTPRVFRNTELIYSNTIAEKVVRLGFDGMLAEGVHHFMAGENEGQLFHAKDLEHFPLLLRNRQLSDDIGFRFQYLEDAGKLSKEEEIVRSMKRLEGHELFNIFLDFETFGEHYGGESGIVDFLCNFPKLALQSGFDFITPSEAISSFPIEVPYDIENPISWADQSQDVSAWLENSLQKESFRRFREIGSSISYTQKIDFEESWRKMSTSDHYYYMSRKSGPDGDVHQHFSPYNSSVDAYLNYVNVLNDLEYRFEL